MNTQHGWTGLNSYLVRCASGDFLYDVASKTTGSNPAFAPVFLWTPESVPDAIAALERRIPWAGNISAVRAR